MLAPGATAPSSSLSPVALSPALAPVLHSSPSACLLATFYYSSGLYTGQLAHSVTQPILWYFQRPLLPPLPEFSNGFFSSTPRSVSSNSFSLSISSSIFPSRISHLLLSPFLRISSHGHPILSSAPSDSLLPPLIN